MTIASDQRRKVAEFLLRIKAIQLRPQDPFTWASGRLSPIYCDNRKLLSHPSVRTFVRQLASELVTERFGKPDGIAGVATGGIALGALVAQELGVPFCYVRSSAKAHGTGRRVEGDLDTMRNVVVIEDLISTGKSSLEAVAALREEDIEVKGLVAIFSYGFADARARFEEARCPFEVLTDYPTMLAQAQAEGYITEDQTTLLESWSSDPVSWSDQRQKA
jgi:orotate phosphoribosyltransferase